MNFKIYAEDKLLDCITSINDFSYTIFSQNNYSKNLENHIASKISQNFLFFVSKELVYEVYSFMIKHRHSKFQFIIIGKSSSADIDLPLEYVLGIKLKSVSKNDFLWYLDKFSNILLTEKVHKSYTAADIRDMEQDQNELIKIGQLLSIERDRDKLIKKILLTSLKITGADAGSVFLVVKNPDGSQGLLFKYSYTFSREIDFKEFVMPLNEESIAGFCAFNDEVVNIPDVYNIPEHAPFSFNRTIDETYDYISKSMLVFPMKNHLGEIQGVIQLINSKEHFDRDESFDETESYRIKLDNKDDFNTKVYPFADRYEDLMLAVAGQASVALDNIKMIKQLEDQFEGMVRASVDAIDSKDPVTSGHSFRVAKMAVKFLECLNNIDYGKYKNLSFNSRDMKQMEYAGLLHDYGKVYIDNDIFLKAKKLFPKDFSILMLRLDLIIQSLKNLPDTIENSKKVHEVIKVRGLVYSLNEPRIFQENPKEVIDGILEYKNDVIVYDSDNNIIPLLTEEEIINLQVGRGTLNDKERKEVESHVAYTQHFLKSIPWPSDLSRIPEIAGGHHEMLDGSGYPDKLTAKDLCIETRILAILDIFDALSASDRPYKKAVPFNRVKSIIKEEGKNGRLDKELIKVFFDYSIYNNIYQLDSSTAKV